MVDPTTPGFAERAAFLLNRDGVRLPPLPPTHPTSLVDPCSWQYCVVKDVLDKPRLDKIRRGCEIAIREMVGRDPARSGNRGSHRYSFGTAPAHFGLQDFWATLKDPPAVVEIMEAIFGTKDVK